MASENGEIFIKNLAQFVRTHEKALANALQLRRQVSKHNIAASTGSESSPTQTSNLHNSTNTSSATGALAAAFSLGTLSFTSHNIKPAKLTLTPHHLFYLLSRFEDLGIAVGAMNVRLENLHTDASPANYVSFLSRPSKSQGRSDRDSIHSVSSVRSVMSGMSSLWSNIGMTSARNAAKTEKAKIQLQTDLKYLYSAFTKIPCLRLSPDRKARLIGGYEEFPFDTAVPLIAFKNVSALEILDMDFRQFYGWDKLAEQLRSLTLKRAHVDDPIDLLLGIVLDDMDKRRRRSSKAQTSPTPPWPASPSIRPADFSRAYFPPSSPAWDDRFGKSSSPRNGSYVRGDMDLEGSRSKARERSTSPTRPTSSQRGSSYRQIRRANSKAAHKRSGSGSSTSSGQSIRGHSRNRSSSNIPSIGYFLPASKWRFLRHLSLADNALTTIGETSLSPLANSLYSLDISSNLFTEVPDCLATLTALRALNLSNCMIGSLHSLSRNPLPAINSLNLRSNRLVSIAGIERLLSLERLDLRDNQLSDPTEVARLTGIPDMREIWVLSNPFVKSYSNYRVTILNLFRSTPGHTEDIVIDAMIPGFSERRQLRERVAETQSVPVIKPVSMESEPKEPSLPLALKAPNFPPDPRVTGQRPVPLTTQSDMAVSAGSRRRRVMKRRIVDLSIDESQPTDVNTPVNIPAKKQQVAFVDSSSMSFPSPDQHRAIINTEPSRENHKATLGNFGENPTTPRSTEKTTTRLQAQAQASSEPSTPPQSAISLADDLEHLNLNGEAYRRKVEALKDEFGSGWLSMLTEDSWPSRTAVETHVSGSEFGQTLSHRPDISNLRSTSQGIVSGSRTLG